jgi:hypothetical protein
MDYNRLDERGLKEIREGIRKRIREGIRDKVIILNININ